MTAITVVLAFASAICLGLGLVITQFGLRYMPPVAGAAIALSFSTILFLCGAPFVLHEGPPSWRAVLLFISIGILFPAVATLLTYEANRLLGPIVTGTLGNLAPLFAVALAFVLLGEPLRLLQVVGLAAIILGVVMLGFSRGGSTARWSSWFLLLPVIAAAVRGLTQPMVKIGLELWPSPYAATLIGIFTSLIIVLAVMKARMKTFIMLPLTH